LIPSAARRARVRPTLSRDRPTRAIPARDRSPAIKRGFFCLQGCRYVAERRDARERRARDVGTSRSAGMAVPAHPCAPRHSDILSIARERRARDVGTVALARPVLRDTRTSCPSLRSAGMAVPAHPCAPRHSDILSIAPERRTTTRCQLRRRD
jgi:hypothetical protein